MKTALAVVLTAILGCGAETDAPPAECGAGAKVMSVEDACASIAEVFDPNCGAWSCGEPGDTVCSDEVSDCRAFAVGWFEYVASVGGDPNLMCGAVSDACHEMLDYPH